MSHLTDKQKCPVSVDIFCDTRHFWINMMETVPCQGPLNLLQCKFLLCFLSMHIRLLWFTSCLAVYLWAYIRISVHTCTFMCILFYCLNSVFRVSSMAMCTHVHLCVFCSNVWMFHVTSMLMYKYVYGLLRNQIENKLLLSLSPDVITS